MKRLLYFAIFAITMALAVVSCDDTTYSMGSSLIEDKVEVVMDSSFELSGQSVANPRVQSRTVMQLIGSLNAEGYGRLRSDVVSQFMPGFVLPVDSFSREDIDSIKLIMHMVKGCFTGDSTIPMGIKVFPLNKQLPSPIYSDFNPTDYYDASQLWGSSIYTASALGTNDSIMALNTRRIEVMLPRTFAQDIYDRYKNSPETFQTPQTFAQWFPGLYIANSFGSGRVTRVEKSYITMYYHIDKKSPNTGNDTTYNYTNTYLAVTPEVITNNNIRFNISPALTQRVEDGEALMVAPTGYDVAIRFPAKEIIDRYRSQSGPIALLNGLSMEIPAEEITNNYGINIPQTILLVKTSKLNEFFAKNMIADNIESFYATYNSATRSYHFSGLQKYILKLMEDENATVSDDDMNFTLTPVNITTETQGNNSIVTGMVPYVTNPVMVKLNLDKAKIKLTFSKQQVDL